MSCRRCADCEISYPLTVHVCRVCNDTTAYISSIDPDPAWQETVELALSDRPSGDEVLLRAWRFRILTGLGFSGGNLEILVERPTDLHLATRLIGEDCPLDVAYRILT